MGFMMLDSIFADANRAKESSGNSYDHDFIQQLFKIQPLLQRFVSWNVSIF
jgi:hypothetical protein